MRRPRPGPDRENCTFPEERNAQRDHEPQYGQNDDRTGDGAAQKYAFCESLGRRHYLTGINPFCAAICCPSAVIGQNITAIGR